MAPSKKKNNSKPTTYDKNFFRAYKWPNLPQQLINSIGKKPHLNLFQNIGSPGVTKTWKTQSKRCPKSPNALKLHHTYNDQLGHNNRSRRINSILSLVRKRRERIYGRILGCSHGWIITSDHQLSSIRSHWFVPSWDSKDAPIQRVALSAPLFVRHPYGRSLLAITGCSSPAFAVHRYYLRDEKGIGLTIKEWSKYDATLVDPNDPDRGLMRFTNAVGSKGKFYVLTLQGTLVVIEDDGSEFRITKLCWKRVVPSSPSRRFTEYLIESEGEILLVFLVFRQKEMSSVDDVEVFRLCQPGGELSWIEKKGLGDRTIFLGIDCSICVTASRVGCRRNTIYFAHHLSVNSWRLYDMETRSILPCFDSIGSELKSPVWEEPIDEEYT